MKLSTLTNIEAVEIVSQIICTDRELDTIEPDQSMFLTLIKILLTIYMIKTTSCTGCYSEVKIDKRVCKRRRRIIQTIYVRKNTVLYVLRPLPSELVILQATVLQLD